jgi:muramoyltetrapeptide carboxypeptidase
LKTLRELGHELRVGKTCTVAHGASTLSPKEIADELHTALEDPEVDGVIAAVGGWTLITVLSHVDLDRVAAARKPLIGYSDLSTLLNAVSSRTGLVTFLGPMVLSEWGEAGGPWTLTRASFEMMLFGLPTEEVVLPQATSWSDEPQRWESDHERPRAVKSGGDVPRVLAAGEVTGVLCGGSLLALELLVGTPYWRVPSEALIVLDAESIAPDELWARLFHLVAAGTFDGARGVVLGRLARPRPTASGFADFDAVVRSTLPESLPVAAGFDIGHAEPMLTLPLGATARLRCPAEGVPALSLLPVREMPNPAC